MIGILGGGLTGLTLGYLIPESEVLEIREECGGLLRSLTRDGFTFDLCGGHIIFSKHDEPLNFMLDLLERRVNRIRRNTKVYYNGRYVKYPFENGLSDLDPEENFECLMDFIRARIQPHPQPTNFREWILQMYGESISRKYLIPYNRKIWKCDPSEISLEWVRDRLPNPSIEDVVRGSLGLGSEGYVHQLYFYYPKRGGIQSLARSLERKSNVIRGFRLERIERDGNGWRVYGSDDERFYDHLISTIPLPELVRCFDSPRTVLDAAGMLNYNSLINVMIGVDREKINDLCWLYFPGDEIFHRVNFISNYSDEITPRGKSSMTVEITYREGDEISGMGDGEILRRVKHDLDRSGIVKPEEICFEAVHREKYAYIVYDHNYRKSVDTIKHFFSEMGIILCGRFGEWEYLNMDACVMRAMKVAADVNEKLL